MLSTLVFALVSATLVLGHHDPSHMGTELRAIARLWSPQDLVQGNITFTQLADLKVHIEGTILGMSHGKYAVHIHEKGDITGGCLSTKGHFNPEKKNHGHPNDVDRHVGDLGNIEFDDTRIARIDLVDSQISLTGPHSIIGRAFVMHEREDDFGRTAHPDSRTTGNAGGRVACGVIGILDPPYGWQMNGAERTSLSALLSVVILFYYLNFA